MENDKLKVITEEGEEIEIDVLFTFDSEETGKSYIAYTDNTKDIYGNVQVFASIYSQTDEKITLEPIETKQEWDAVDAVLTSLHDEIRKSLQDYEDI